MDFLTALEMTLVGFLVYLVWMGFSRFVDNLRHARMMLCAIRTRSAALSDYYHFCVSAEELMPPVLDVSAPAAHRPYSDNYWLRHDFEGGY